MAQVTLTDFENRVWGRLENNTEFYTKDSVDRTINEGARVVNLFSGFNQGRVQLGQTVANWLFYRIPTQIIFPMKVYLDGREMIKNTVAGLSGTQPKWMRGTPGRTSGWTPIGSRLFALTPPDGQGGRFIEVLGVITPPLLVSPTDFLSLDDTFASLIIGYSIMNLTLREGGRVFQDASRELVPWSKKMRELGRWTTVSNPNFYVETSDE